MFKHIFIILYPFLKMGWPLKGTELIVCTCPSLSDKPKYNLPKLENYYFVHKHKL